MNLGHPSFYYPNYPKRVFNLKLRGNQQPSADKSSKSEFWYLIMKFKICCAKWVKGYGTGYSQAVTHPSTNPACGCLTSEIERDRVHSTEYGRIEKSTLINVLYTGCDPGTVGGVQMLQKCFKRSIWEKHADADTLFSVESQGNIVEWNIRSRNLRLSSV